MHRHPLVGGQLTVNDKKVKIFRKIPETPRAKLQRAAQAANQKDAVGSASDEPIE